MPQTARPYPTAIIFSSVTIIFFSSSISSRRCAAFSNSSDRAASFIWNSKSFTTRYMSSRVISSLATWYDALVSATPRSPSVMSRTAL